MQVQVISDTKPVVDYLATTLQTHLQNGERVTWLVPGGSAIALAVAVSRRLTEAETDMSKLALTLTDERFGPPEHADSNWRQLEEAGLLLPGAHLFPVLTGKDLPETLKDYNERLETFLNVSDFSIGLFGMGADGHTAGILPESPAATAETYATAYDSPPYTRITMTFRAIRLLHESVIYAAGDEKASALASLIDENISVEKQPAQVHKTLPSSTLFTDQKGKE